MSFSVRDSRSQDKIAALKSGQLLFQALPKEALCLNGVIQVSNRPFQFIKKQNSTIFGQCEVSGHAPIGPDTLTVSGSTLTNQAGNNGEAAIRVDGAETAITLNNSTFNSGRGAGVTQHTFLNVTSVDRAGVAFSSVVNLIANSSTLNGDILADADSTTNVSLRSNTGAYFLCRHAS
jgi:hypothetical protein